jgi:hypothetical protein
MEQRVLDLLQVLLDYHELGQTPEPSDCILGFGTNDPRVAERSAELYLSGLAPWLLFSGAVSLWTQGLYEGTEAEHFARIAIAKGVPESAIIIEARATNTGENVRYSRELLSAKGIAVRRAIVVQKPYMERRTYATFRRVWPEPEIFLASPKLTLDSLALPHLPLEEVINIVVGDLDRIRKYPALGFQIEQEIPADVQSAFQELVSLGFGKHLVPEPPAVRP